MKKFLIITLLFLTSCSTHKDLNTREIDSAIDILDYSAIYIDEEVVKGNIDLNAGTSILENLLITKNYLLKTKKKTSKIKLNKLANVKIKGGDGELKHIIVEADLTTEIRTILDDNGYDNFKIIDWELIEADEILVKKSSEEK